MQNGIIRYYVIYVSDLSGKTSWELTSNVTRILIDNLQPFRLYSCSVAAFTIGVGPVSNTVTVRLPQTGQQQCLINLSIIWTHLHLRKC